MTKRQFERNSLYRDQQKPVCCAEKIGAATHKKTNKICLFKD